MILIFYNFQSYFNVKVIFYHKTTFMSIVNTGHQFTKKNAKVPEKIGYVTKKLH